MPRDTARAAAANVRFAGVAVVATGPSAPDKAKRHAAALLDDIKKMVPLEGIAMTVPRNFAIAIVLSALSAVFASQASAQPYPSRPLRIIVSFAPGGTTDVLARAIAAKLTESLGQQAIVDNRGGAYGVIATELLAKSIPDGYTMALLVSPHVVNPFVLKSLPYDSVNDFAPVTLVAIVPNVLTVTPSLPVSTLKELVALARAKPGQLAFAQSTMTSGHLAMELLKSTAGIDILSVPYKGGGQAVIDVISGQAHILLNPPPAMLPHINAGKLNAIALTSARRSPAMPNVPTIAESGFPGFEVNEWYGFFVSAKTPKEIVRKLNQEIVKAIRSPDINERLTLLAAEPVANSPEEFAQFLKKEREKWGPLVKKIGLKVD